MPPHLSRHPVRLSDPESSHELGPCLRLDTRVSPLGLKALRGSPKYDSEKNPAYPPQFPPPRVMG